LQKFPCVFKGHQSLSETPCNMTATWKVVVCPPYVSPSPPNDLTDRTSAEPPTPRGPQPTMARMPERPPIEIHV
jgi:hypothetical protein